ncbi:MAG: hypothetical protein LBM99_03775 [Bacillales bacterium]|jgi:hypothetical protein|nr:hypothetical protein [Bacillales bacterium]
MKKICGLLLIVSSLIGLFGCKPYDIYKRNVKWKSDDDILEFKIEGSQSGLGYGKIKVEDEYMNIVVILGLPRIQLRIYNEEKLLESIERNNDNIVFLELGGTKVNYKVDEIEWKVNINNSNLDYFDDMVIITKRTDIPLGELNAINHLGASWKNQNNDFELNSSALVYFTHEIFGEILLNQNKTPIKFMFLEDNKFEIYSLVEDTLISNGSYSTVFLESEKNQFYDESKLLLSFDYKVQGFDYPDSIELIDQTNS